MKRLKCFPLVLVLIALLVLPLLIGATPAKGIVAAGLPFASGRILVKFQPELSVAQRAALHRAQGGRALEVIPDIDVEVVSVPKGAERAKVAAYARNPLVVYAEPDYIAYALGDPDDVYFTKQWGMDNDGQPYKDGQAGTADADIDAPEAWAITTGASTIKIAILDTGIDPAHPDLKNKLVGNKNFTDSGSSDDFYGHGTHVAGIAAAETDNGLGVAGVGYNCSLMNVKVLNDSGGGYYSWIAKGIEWATDQGAKVINMSLGAKQKSRALEDAVNYAWIHGVVVVAAAGNDGNPSPNYPAKYENCLAVAATDSKDQKASFSQYGDWVDVAAPGVDIFSTFPIDDFVLRDKYGKEYYYDFGSGTSMATPFVSGLAGLLWAQGYTTNADVRAQIEATADPISGTGTYWVWGRINACKAVGGIACDGPEDNPPSVTIVNPAEGAVVAGAVTIQIEATDVEDSAGSLSVDWNVDGGPWLSTTYNSPSGYYEATWDTMTASEGSHTINARATDSAGNVGGDSNSVVVDNEPSSAVSVTSIEPATMQAGTTIGVTITGSGFAAGAEVTFANGNGPAPIASNVLVSDPNTIIATVTAKSGGPPRNRVWDVRVTNPDGSSGVLPGGFTVTP